jgi:hypothetical protein
MLRNIQLRTPGNSFTVAGAEILILTKGFLCCGAEEDAVFDVYDEGIFSIAC